MYSWKREPRDSHTITLCTPAHTIVYTPRLYTRFFEGYSDENVDVRGCMCVCIYRVACYDVEESRVSL